MAKRKGAPQADENKAWDWLFYGIVVVALIAGIAYIYTIRDTLTGFFQSAYEYVADTFGLGIALLACALITAIFLLWRKRVTLLFRYWYVWLGIIAATVGVWGILAFYGVGGVVGNAIIGERDGWGGFRIALIFIVALMLAFPRAVRFLARRLIRAVADWRAERRERAANKPVVVKPVVRQKVVQPQVPAKEEVEEQEPVRAERKPPKEKAEEPAPRGLKQIAAEVWKK